eukprot:1158967-Pelagomonas_calceolata.AAC.9
MVWMACAGHCCTTTLSPGGLDVTEAQSQHRFAGIYKCCHCHMEAGKRMAPFLTTTGEARLMESCTKEAGKHMACCLTLASKARLMDHTREAEKHMACCLTLASKVWLMDDTKRAEIRVACAMLLVKRLLKGSCVTQRVLLCSGKHRKTQSPIGCHKPPP